MKKVILYQYVNDSNEVIVTTEPMLETSAQIFYLLTADEGYYLHNKKLHHKRKSTITPEYLADNWEELKQKEGNK